MFTLVPYFWGPLFLLLVLFFSVTLQWNLSLLFLLSPSLLGGWHQASFFFVLFFVSFSILMFSYYYFSSGSDYFMFMGLLFSFIMSMALLIFHKGPLMLFVGWDGLGVTSYLLVLYYLNSKGTAGAMTTVMTNRLGDVFLFIFIVSMSLMTSLGDYYSLLSVFLVLCAFTKSAQAPFSSWLPMAMSAPTPVSSLVHSSTLVTAGLYLLMKYSFFWSGGTLLSVLLGFGVVTMFVASSMALAEKDFKKIIALSTLSQLGFMMTGMGLGCLTLSFFHLLTHAFFKSCMFVQVGGMILVNNTSQDGRSYSFSGSQTMLVALGISCLSLCGFPFLSGFYSKDLVLSGVLGPAFKVAVFLFCMFGVFLTFLYSLRIMIFSSSGGPQPSLKLVSSLNYSSSSVLLVLLGTMSGYIFFTGVFTPPIILMGVEKMAPLMFWLSLVLFPFLFLKKVEQLSGMALQDQVVQQAQKIMSLPLKPLEAFQLSFLGFLSGGMSSGALSSLRVPGGLPLVLSLLLLFLMM